MTFRLFWGTKTFTSGRPQPARCTSFTNTVFSIFTPFLGEKYIEVWFNPERGAYPSEYLDALLATRFD